jgi:hypothetical protein
MLPTMMIMGGAVGIAMVPMFKIGLTIAIRLSHGRSRRDRHQDHLHYHIDVSIILIVTTREPGLSYP